MFWIDVDQDLLGEHQTCGGDPDVGCNGLHGPEPDITLNDMSVQATALAVRRSQGAAAMPDSALRSFGLGPGDDLFAEYELEAALAMAEEAMALAPEIRAILTPLLTENMRADDVYEAIYKADRLWRAKSWQKGTAQRFSEAMTNAVAAGVYKTNSAVFLDPIFRNRIIDGMVRAGKYYTNEYFNRQAMPALISAVERAVSGDMAGSRAGYKIVQETLNARLKSVPYWQVVANVAASRSYHYGVLRAGVSLGKRTYQYTAVMDERTSTICAALHGTTWSVDSAMSLMDQIAQLEDPEDVKDIGPWPSVKELLAMSDDDLRLLGVMVPPMHPRCRSTIILL